MTGVLGVFAAAAALAAPAPHPLDAQHLPSLPQRGLAHDTLAGVELQTMRGRALGILEGLDLAPDKAVAHGLLMRSPRGRLLILDLNERRIRRFYEAPSTVPTCRLTDARIHRELFVCGSLIRMVVYGPPGSTRTLRVVARAPGQVGHWVWAEFAPSGPGFLAQWSAECEVPLAFVVSGSGMRPYGGNTIRDAPESAALGWLPNGSAVIHFPKGACGRTLRRPGIYSVPRRGTPSLLLSTPRNANYAMWGG
jgi:hypothetical protein